MTRGTASDWSLLHCTGPDYNMTLPGNLKGKWTFYLLENYDV